MDAGHRDVVALHGPDRLRWLHDLTTQHLADLPPRRGHPHAAAEPLGARRGGRGGGRRRHDHVAGRRRGGRGGASSPSWSGCGSSCGWRSAAAGGTCCTCWARRRTGWARLPGCPCPAPCPHPRRCWGRPRGRSWVPRARRCWCGAGPTTGWDLLVEPAAVVATAERLQSAGARPAGLLAADALAVAARRPRLARRRRRARAPLRAGTARGGGCTWRRAATGARRPWRGCTTWGARRGGWSWCTWTAARWTCRTPAPRWSRPTAGVPSGGSAGRCATRSWGPVALALVKRSADVSGPPPGGGPRGRGRPPTTWPCRSTPVPPRPSLARLGR